MQDERESNGNCCDYVNQETRQAKLLDDQATVATEGSTHQCSRPCVPAGERDIVDLINPVEFPDVAGCRNGDAQSPTNALTFFRHDVNPKFGRTNVDKEPMENGRNDEDLRELEVHLNKCLLNESIELITESTDGETRNSDNHERFDLLSNCSRNVILKILGYLQIKQLVHNVSLVSKSWYSLAFDPALWCKIDLRGYVVNDIVMSKIPQLCNFISYILLPDAYNDDFTDDGLICLAKGCPLLHTFIAPRCGNKFTDRAIIAFTEHCRDLKELYLEALDVSDLTLKSIAQNLTKLEYLNICQVHSITNDGVAEILKGCRHLDQLLVSQNHQITDEFFSGIAECSKSLTRLEVMMCNIKPTGIPMLGQLHNLEVLNLTQCIKLTTEDLIPVLKGCKKLYCLGLNLDKLIDDECIDIIFTHLPHLRNIYLVSTIITDEALNIMGQKAKSLERVDVGYTKVTEVGARRISELCTTLNYLSLVRCDQVSESFVAELVIQYPHIMYSTFIQDAKRLLKRVEEEEAREKAEEKEARKKAEERS